MNSSTGKPRAIAAIIFDMDGLMIDSESLYWAAGRDVAKRLGAAVKDQTLGRMMGRSPVDSMRVFKEELHLEESPERLLEMRDTIALESMKNGVPAMPGLFEALDEFRPKYKLAVATSAPFKYVEPILSKLGILAQFDVIQTSDDVVHGKPDPEIYLKAMARLRVPPERCIVLEDSSNGALAGKRAGAYTIAVPSQYTREQEFGFVDYVASDLLDAARHIKAMFG